MIFSYPTYILLIFDAPIGHDQVGISQSCDTIRWRKYNDMFSRLDTMLECDGRMDRIAVSALLYWCVNADAQ